MDVGGWGQIDTWGVWEEVPAAYQKAWSSASITVLPRVNEAVASGTPDQVTWAWRCPSYCFVSQRGQGSGELARRFEAVREGSWGSLLLPLRQEEEREARRRQEARQGQEPGPDQMEAQLRKTVLSMVARGEVGRARMRVTSHGMANTSDPRVRPAVLTK